MSVRSPCRDGEVSMTATPGSIAPSDELTLPLRVEVWRPWAAEFAARPRGTVRASASTEAARALGNHKLIGSPLLSSVKKLDGSRLSAGSNAGSPQGEIGRIF